MIIGVNHLNIRDNSKVFFSNLFIEGLFCYSCIINNCFLITMQNKLFSK